MKERLLQESTPADADDRLPVSPVNGEKTSEYISSLVPDLPDWLADTERRAKREEVPIIRKEAQGLLRFLLSARQPKSILEVGTAVGFSAAFMEDCVGYGVPLTTIEKVPARIEAAKRLFAERSELAAITLREGDAAEVLAELAAEGRKYDFVFLDAAKAQYPIYWQLIRPLLADGAYFVADNVLQEGSIAESKFTVQRRDRTIHLRMREFVRELFGEKSVVSTLLPVGDGMTVSVYHER
jgi:predicted O-methyltransferase YrrM